MMFTVFGGGGDETAIAQPPPTADQQQGEEEEEEGEEGEARSKQFIMEIDYQTYLESIELYGIRESVIPTRGNKVDSLAGREALAGVRSQS